jgi:glycosyltransferase involved in cell wall biosynthesis
MGGAAIAASRLMKALNKHGAKTKMLVRDKQTDDENVISVNRSWLKRKINFVRFTFERLIIFISNGFNYQNLFAVSIANTGTNISKHPLVRDADIIHLHWINQGFLSLKDIRQLIKTGKPIIWTMHDMWAATGICHYAHDCNKYQDKCQTCFFLRSSGYKDLSPKVFNNKKMLFKGSPITLVACSKWLSGKAQTSAFLQRMSVLSIPNPIDTSVFFPDDVIRCRKELDLPMDKKLLLFGAVNVADKRKGIDYLVEAANLIKNQDMEIVIFGQAKQEITELFPFPIHFMGYMREEKQVVKLYNAVDAYVIPSLEDNLPNTIMESLACGTPCIGFNSGGIPEMIDHKINGYIAEYKSSEDLAKGICWTLFETDYEQLSQNARRKAVECYSEEVVAEQYMEKYTKVKS